MILLQHRLRIAITAVASLLIGAAIAFSMKVSFTATILPPQPLWASLVPSQGWEQAGLEVIEEPRRHLCSMLESLTIGDRIINQFHFQSLWKEKKLEDTRKVLNVLNYCNKLHWFKMLSVIVLTLNAAADWPRFAPALLRCVRPDQVLVMDSESTDGTVELVRAAGFQVHSVERAEFNHGGTRQLAAQLLPNAEILVFMTQDAVLASRDSLSKLLAAFDNPKVAAAYGRQLPRPQAGAIEAHARSFNYPPTSDLRDLKSRDRLGFKAAFISNSFAAYRGTALMEIGGFPSDVIFGEDTITAAHLLLAEYEIAYVAEACVYHSHAYSWIQEFKRYFDIGVLHNRERWMLEEFGGAGGEGRRFVISELRYLLKWDSRQIPSALVRTGLKFIAYRLGRIEALLAPSIKRQLSMNPRFWDEAISNKRG